MDTTAAVNYAVDNSARCMKSICWRAGISRQTLYRWRHGHETPKPGKVRALFEAAKVDVNSIDIEWTKPQCRSKNVVLSFLDGDFTLPKRSKTGTFSAAYMQGVNDLRTALIEQANKL